MKRFIDDELLRWKEKKRRKPLIIRGARQVGKTYSARAFGEKHFKNLALVDLERHPEWHKIFDGNLDAARICADLEILLNQKITPGETLLLMDEIQACPNALKSIRYFFEELPGLHLVAAGSLLEFVMNEISFPVGRMQFMYLQPMCFAEYLMATGNSEAAEIVKGRPGPLGDAVHAFLCDELRRYFFVGGMPESVESYAQTGSMRESFEVQAEICETYRMDFGKYRPQVDRQCLHQVLSSVARHVGFQLKYARLAEGFSNPTIKKAFDLLCLANVAVRIPAADPSGMPLEAGASPKRFKAILTDIGLMRYLSGMSVDVEYTRSDLLAIYRGAIAEQFVGQEMRISQNNSLYYWSREKKSSAAEVDYLAVIDGKIHPVEIKSGSSGSLKSLHLCLENYPNCPSGIVFSESPYAELPEQRIRFIPLYFAGSATRMKSGMPDSR